MNKICVIGVYFGKLPNYFSLWLKSCELNEKIDFMIFSDQFIESKKNIFYHNLTLKEFKQMACDCLKFEVSMERPYKCCDYKPLYGLLFKDYIKDYEYWGHCDFDLIFGDLNFFFEKYNLAKYDRFLPLGHLSLYRNTNEVNNRYKCNGGSTNFKIIFTNDKNYVFDEMPGMTAIYWKNNFPFFTKRIFSDIASVHHRFRIIEDSLFGKKPKNYKKQIFYFENGKTYRAYFNNGNLKKEEYIYVHFKRRPNFSVDFNLEDVDAFYITNKGFIPKRGEVSMDIIDKYNKYPGCFFEFGEKLRFKLNGFMGKIKNKLRSLYAK